MCIDILPCGELYMSVYYWEIEYVTIHDTVHVGMLHDGHYLEL